MGRRGVEHRSALVRSSPVADETITVDDLVTGKAAADLGEGQIPTRAILIVETISDEGNDLRYVLSEGLMAWQALGMIRSAQLHIERLDIESWNND
jgi:hypothetical protein